MTKFCEYRDCAYRAAPGKRFCARHHTERSTLGTRIGMAAAYVVLTIAVLMMLLLILSATPAKADTAQLWMTGNTPGRASAIEPYPVGSNPWVAVSATAGCSGSEYTRAGHWRRSGGVEWAPVACEDHPGQYPLGISGSGRIFGNASSCTSHGSWQWEFGDPIWMDESQSWDIDNSGTRIAGNQSNFGPTVWIDGTPRTLPTVYGEGWATAITADGGTVYGSTNNDLGEGYRPCRWDDVGGAWQRSPLEGELPSYAGWLVDVRSASPSGEWLVIDLHSPDGADQAIWHAGRYLELDAAQHNWITWGGISDEGVVVGVGAGHARIWHPSWDATRGLEEMLRYDYGLWLWDWDRLSWATGITADGQYVSGYGRIAAPDP